MSPESKKERLNKAYEYLRFKGVVKNQVEVAKAIGSSRSNVSSAFNGDTRALTNNFIIRFAKSFPQISLDWILNGNGSMTTEEQFNETSRCMQASAFNHTAKEMMELSKEQAIIGYEANIGRPYYNVDFRMGFDLGLNDQTINPEYMIDCQPYNNCDCWCNARGDSMQPTISNGDVIAIKEVNDPRSCLVSGEIYAIVTTNDLRTIKRIKDNGETVTLVPDNKDYPEQTISKEVILKVYRVVGSMKMF